MTDTMELNITLSPVARLMEIVCDATHLYSNWSMTDDNSRYPQSYCRLYSCISRPSTDHQ